MNYSKLIFTAILAVLFSLSTLTVNSLQSTVSAQTFSEAPANYYVYVYIDGICWRYEYDNDGKLVEAEIIDIH